MKKGKEKHGRRMRYTDHRADWWSRAENTLSLLAKLRQRGRASGQQPTPGGSWPTPRLRRHAEGERERIRNSEAAQGAVAVKAGRLRQGRHQRDHGHGDAGRGREEEPGQESRQADALDYDHCDNITILRTVILSLSSNITN